MYFGEFIDFSNFYYEKCSTIDIKERKRHKAFVFCVRKLRNVSAHNTCILNNLTNKTTNINIFQPCIELHNKLIPLRKSINFNINKKIQNVLIHDLLCLLYLYADVASNGAKKYAKKKILMFLKRCQKHSIYFKKHDEITSKYNFISKVFLHIF